VCVTLSTFKGSNDIHVNVVIGENNDPDNGPLPESNSIIIETTAAMK
jgi:hypothetical protein